jgi:hypothetical protein
VGSRATPKRQNRRRPTAADCAPHRSTALTATQKSATLLGMIRRSKSTPARGWAILVALSRGNGIEQAARAVGIGGATLGLFAVS